MWEINSVGDIDFLLNILQGVAMLTSSGSLRAGAALGALMGLLLVMVMGLASDGKEFRIQQVVLGWVFFVVMFGTTASVQVNDRYSGRSEIVAGVPWGMAAVGSVFSTVGYWLTTGMEQAFSWPGMSGQHYGSALNAIMAGRMVTQSPDRATGKYLNSLKAFIRDCALTGVEFGEMGIDQIFREPSAMEGMKVTGQLYTTQTWLNVTGTRPDDITCADAWQQLNSYNVQPIADRALEPALGPNGAQRIGEAYTNLNQALTNQQQYMQNLYVLSVWNDAVAQGYAQRQDEASAAILVSANTQRQIQFASEQSLFLRMMRPTLAFFEGLLYAISPIIAFVLVFGAFGLKMTGKYLLVGLWVQMWMPVLAVINLFQYIGMTKFLNALTSDGGTTVQSIQAILLAQDKAADWVALGGMLSAATPAIALALVYGGSVAMTSLTNRITGSDMVNEKIGSPDVAQSSPLVSTGGFYASTPGGGMRLQGGDPVFARFGTNASSQESLSSMQRETSAKQEQFAKKVAGALRSEGYSRQDVSNALGVRESDTSGWSNDRSVGREVGDASNLTKQLQTNRSRTESGSVSAGAGLSGGGGGAGGTVNGSLSQSIATSDIAQNQTNQGSSSAFRTSNAERASAGHNAAVDITSGNSKLLGMLKSSSQSSEISRDAADVLRAEKAFEQATRFSQDTSRGHSVDAKTAAAYYANSHSDADISQLAHWAETYGSKRAFAEYHAEATQPGASGLPLIADPREAKAYAALMTLSDDKGYVTDRASSEEHYAARRREFFFEAIGDTPGLRGMTSEGGSATSRDAGRNAGMAVGMHKDGAVADLARGLAEPSGVSSVRSAAEGAVSQAPSSVSASGERALQSSNHVGDSRLTEGNAEAWNAHEGSIHQGLRDQASTMKTSSSIPEMIGGTYEATSAAATRALGSFSGFDRAQQQMGFEGDISTQLGGSRGIALAAQYAATYHTAFVDQSSASWADPLNPGAATTAWNAAWSTESAQELRSAMVEKYGPDVVAQFDRDLASGAFLSGDGARTASGAILSSWDRTKPE